MAITEVRHNDGTSTWMNEEETAAMNRHDRYTTKVARSFLTLAFLFPLVLLFMSGTVVSPEYTHGLAKIFVGYFTVIFTYPVKLLMNMHLDIVTIRVLLAVIFLIGILLSRFFRRGLYVVYIIPYILYQIVGGIL